MGLIDKIAKKARTARMKWHQEELVRHAEALVGFGLERSEQDIEWSTMAIIVDVDGRIDIYLRGAQISSTEIMEMMDATNSRTVN